MEPMKAGKRSVVHGWKNQLQVAAVKMAGGGIAAELHRKQAEPGSGEDA